MAKWMARLFGTSEVHLFLARELSAAAPVQALDVDAQIEHVGGPSGGHYDGLRGYCAACGFPADWEREMLELGASATIAMERTSGAVMAMGWQIDRAFEVEEIAAWFDPAPGIYLFGDFVLPAFRGRGLQRLLVNRRLSHGVAGGIPIAWTIVHSDNVPSMKSYQAEGFAPAAHFIRRQWLGRTRLSCRAANGAAVPLQLRGNRVCAGSGS